MHLLCGIPAKGRRAGAKCSTALSGVVLDKEVSDLPITWVWPSNPFEEDVVEDRASCGNYSPRFGSWSADTVLEEDGELAPRRHRDVAVAAPCASRGHPSLCSG